MGFLFGIGEICCVQRAKKKRTVIMFMKEVFVNVDLAIAPRPDSTQECASPGKRKKGATAPAGWTMSNAGKWFKAERSFVISNAHILLSAIVMAFFMGVFSFILAKRFNMMEMDGHKYSLIGMANTEVNGVRVFSPVFKEVQ